MHQGWKLQKTKIIGAGTEFKVSNDVTLNAGLRFFQSFTDLTDDGGRYDDGTKEDSKGILSSLDFRIGISF
jgi:opacity protein-like surface antigen